MARPVATSPAIRVYGPDDLVKFEHDLDRPFVIGRLPGKDGIVIGEGDISMPRQAVRLVANDGRVTITNSSTSATLQVQGTRGTRYLDPGEELTIVQNTTAWIAGRGTSHRVEITGIRAQIRPTLTGNFTRRALGSARSSGPRQEVLVALCLPRFEPGDFAKSTLATKEILAELTKAGTRITRREVDNKLQRMRLSYSRRAGRALATREILAEYVLESGFVTSVDVRAFRERQRQQVDEGIE